MASAAYWWSGVATAAVRGAHYVLGHELASWLLLVADDLAVLMPHERIRETVLLLLTYLRVMGFPLSWKKLAGGESLQWVEYELLLKNSSLGLSESRARLVHSAVQGQVSADARVSRGSRKGGVRLRSTGLRPPVPCSSVHAPQTVKPLPLYVLVTLEYLRRKILQTHHCPCGLQRQSWKQAWRVDAHADEDGVGVGRWWPQADEKGLVTTKNSPWFAVKVTPENAPWAFQKEGKAYRVIATLEASGMLLALLAFGPSEQLSNTRLAVQVPAFTDNKSNGYVVNKLMTTRFPLCVVVMELAAQAERRGVRLEAEWTPRDRNQEADDLSNLRTNSFDPQREVKINLKGQSWLVLPALLEAGQQFHAQKAAEVQQRKLEELHGKRKKRKKDDKLKFREKW